MGTIELRQYDATTDTDAIVEVSLRAWTPVFASMRTVLGDEIFELEHPGGWEAMQAQAVRDTIARLDTTVGLLDGVVAGFVAVDVTSNPTQGEVEMIAVDPSGQRTGLGRVLFDHGVEAIRAAGKEMAIVGTGGDPGHAPARALYEDAGFTGMPIVRYYKVL